MKFEELYKSRYSVRSFEDKMIPEEELKKIYNAGIYVPSAKNRQPLKVYVVKSKEGIEKINRVSRCIFGAPLVLICCFDHTQVSIRKDGKKNAGVQDVSIAVTQMMLEAWNLGIGSCWINLFDEEKLKEEFGIPEHIEPVCLLDLGYPSKDSTPLELHHIKKTEKEIFEEV